MSADEPTSSSTPKPKRKLKDSDILETQEKETSINIPINREMYEKLKYIFNEISQDVIMYFGDNYRISNERAQLKIVKTVIRKTKILYYNDTAYFIPFVRKDASEYPAAMPQKLVDVSTIILRTVIYTNTLPNTNKVMRVAVEQTSSASNASTYSLTAEVEYDQLSFYRYKFNTEVENEFFDVFLCNFLPHLSTLGTKDLFKPLEPDNIRNFASRIFKSMRENYICSEDEVITYKFDGHKAKIRYSNGLMVYEDYDVYCTGSCKVLEAYPNIAFQLEVLPDNVMFITDILGGFTSNVISNKLQCFPLPLDVLEFFSWFRKHWKERGVCEPYKLTLNDKSGVVEYKLYTQFPIVPGTPTTHKHPYDGYIITLNDFIIKYKVPTIDVVMKNGYLEISGMYEAICSTQYEGYENDRIYEVRQNANGEYLIIRKRNDRTTPCTKEQYLAYLEELSCFRNNIKASASETSQKKLQELNNKFKALT
ncbi:LEF-4 [Macrobrachium rosenbergii nudivirus]|nr:LEF-4 [Macrobrachium rosenbergii nudivirus]